MGGAEIVINQKGISLMEVLVTVLVLGIGLLGVAALQLTSLNANQEGYYRSQATEIAENLASKMRVAKNELYNGSSLLSDIVADYDSTSTAFSCTAAATSCVDSVCTQAQRVAYDRWQVCDAAQNDLPDGEVFVTVVNGIRARIAVAWTPTSARTDLGQVQVLNQRCTGLGVADTKDCVILEVIP